MIRSEFIFSTMVIIGVLYLAMLLYPLVLTEATDKLADAGSNTTSGGTAAPFSQSTKSNAEEALALLSPNNILSFSKVVWRLTASSLSYVVLLPKVVYVPLKHTTLASIFVAKTFLSPLHPILAPIYLTLRIIITPALVPALMVYRFAVLVYPLYVFLSAAVICGTLAGLLARRLGRTVIEDVLGIRSLPDIGSGGGKQTSPARERRPRGRTS